MATYKQLSYGSEGDDVKELQKLLNQNNGAESQLAVDGIYGPKTKAAVEAYQTGNSLRVDGIAGDETWGSLTKPAATPSTPSPTDGAIIGNSWQGSTIGGSPTAPSGATNPVQAPGTQDDVVSKAMELLQQRASGGSYQSPWGDLLNSQIEQILRREPFEYDPVGDSLFAHYKDTYSKNGKLAMMDTIGKAQAMTGGYGNTYAQQVGQQTYQGYMQDLNGIIPELHQLALDKYNAETSAMHNRADLLAGMEGQDYDRWYAEQVWKQEYGYPLGGSIGEAPASGAPSATGRKNWDNGNFTNDEVVAAQVIVGANPDGKWGSESQKKAAAMGYNSLEEVIYANQINGAVDNLTGDNTGTSGQLIPVSTDNTDEFIKYYRQIGGKNANKDVLLSAIEKAHKNGMTDSEAMYLLDYYGLWDDVKE